MYQLNRKYRVKIHVNAHADDEHSFRHVSLIIFARCHSKVCLGAFSRIAAEYNETARKNKPVIFGNGERAKKKTHRSEHSAVFFLQFGAAFSGLEFATQTKNSFTVAILFFSYSFFFRFCHRISWQCFYLCLSHKIHLFAQKFSYIKSTWARVTDKTIVEIVIELPLFHYSGFSLLHTPFRAFSCRLNDL